MDSDLKVRKQVTFNQLKALLEFMSEHQELAKGLTRGRRGKLHTLKLWNLCAKKMNVIQDGAVKDGKAWSKVKLRPQNASEASLEIMNLCTRHISIRGSKIFLTIMKTYWCDWKYRVKRRALELKAAKAKNIPPPDGVTPLSGMEENILSIIGEGCLDNIVIKSDPLADEDSEGDEEVNNSVENVLINQCFETQPEPTKNLRGRKRRHSSQDCSDQGGPSSPLAGKLGTNNETESDPEAVEFLRLEREKIENARKLHDTLLTLTSEITRLTDVMSHIRDVFVNNRINI